MVSCWVWSDGYELAESGDSLDRWELIVSRDREQCGLLAVLSIRIGVNADPDPAFYLNADSDPPEPNQGVSIRIRILVRL
jgi:hypothetical protein